MRFVPSRRAGLFIILVLVVCLGLFSLGLFPQDPLRRLAERRLRAAIGPRCRIGQLHIVPISLSVTARDVFLANDSFELAIARGNAALSVDTLLGRALSLVDLELHQPRFRLLPAPTAGDGPTPAMLPPIVLRRVRVTDGYFTYGDAEERLELSGIEIRGAVGRGMLDVRVRHGRAAGPRRLDIESLQASLRLTPQLALVVESFEGATRGSRLWINGRIGPLLGTWRPDLRFSGTIALAELVPPTLKLHGTVSLEGRVKERQGDLEWHADLNGSRLVLADWPIDVLRASLRQSSDVGLRAQANLHARNGRVKLDAILREHLLDASLTARRIQLDDRPLPAGLARAKIDCDVSVKGRLNDRLAARITAHAATRMGPNIDANVDAKSFGWLDLTQKTADMRFTAVADARSRDAPKTPMSLARATLALNGRAAGALSDLMTETAVSGLAALETSTGTRHIEISGELNRKNGNLTSWIEARGSVLSARFDLDARRGHVRRLALEASKVDLSELLPEWRGQADLALTASGPPRALSGRSTISLENAAWRSLEIGSATADFEGTSNGGLISLRMPSFNLDANGDLRLGRRPILRASISFERSPLAPLAALIERPLEGSLSGRAEIDLPLDHPDKMSMEARLQFLEAASEQLRFHLVRPLTLKLDETSFIVDDLAIHGPAVRIEARGTASRAENGPIDLSTSLSMDLARLPGLAPLELDGDVEANVQLSGTRRLPSAKGAILLNHVSARSPTLPPFALDSGSIALEGDALSFDDVRIAFADGMLILRGRLPLESLQFPGNALRTGAAEADLVLEASGLDAGRLLDSISRPEGAHRAQRIDARLSGRLHLSGPPMSLETARARLVLDETRVRSDEADVVVAPVIVTLEDGRAHTDGISLRSEQGDFLVSGDVDILRRRLALEGDGELNLRTLSPFLSDMALGGQADVRVGVHGGFDSPEARGSVDIKDGLLRFRELRQPLTAINGTLLFDRAEIRLQDCSAELGGGRLTLIGGARLASGSVADIRLNIKARDVALHYPPGLRSRLGADLALGGQPGALLLSGRIASQRAIFDRDLLTEETLLAPVPEATKAPLLRTVALDLAIDTVSPLRLSNDIARLDAKGTLVIRGNMESPEPYGALDVVTPGGKFFFQGREYSITSGQIAYQGDWEPILRLSAETYVIKRRTSERHLVKARVNGTVLEISQAWAARRLGLPLPDRIENALVLQSASITEEQQIMDELFGRTAGQQALSLLAGRLSRSVVSELRGLGLDEVSIEPQLVARETDPGARFTFGKRLTRYAQLVYSTSLGGAEQSFAQLEAQPGWNMAFTIQRQIESARDGAFTYGAGQRIRLGGVREDQKPLAEERVTIRALTFDGCPACDTAALTQASGLKTGDRATLFALQDAAERLRKRFARDGYIEAAVSARHAGDEVVFLIRTGRRYTWRVEGLRNYPDLDEEINSSFFEEEAVERCSTRLLKLVRRRGYLRARIETSIEDEDLTRRLVFVVESGPRLEIDAVRFPGARALSPGRLLEASGGAAELLVAPDDARAAILDAYHTAFHLSARVSQPLVHERAGRILIDVPVEEGRVANVSSVTFAGATLPREDLISASGLAIGAPFDLNAVERAINALAQSYAQLGYAEARVSATYSPTKDGDLDLVFTVIEGQRLLLRSIEIQGLRRTREALVRRHLPLKIGEPLDPRRTAEAERRLRELGVFERVIVRRDPTRPDVVRIEIRESPILVGGFDLRYEDREDERRFTDRLNALVDVELRNLLGSAFTIGGRYSVGSYLQESRVSLHGPMPIGGTLTGSVFRLNETLTSSSEAESVESLQTGFDVQHTLRLPDRWDLLFGYRYKRVSFSGFRPVNVAKAELSILRDTRDNPLDARRGRFLSLNLGLAHPRLGSDSAFIKGFAQVFVLRGLGDKLTWAQGYRLGLAHVFDDEPLVAFERFRAGGANSLRGFLTESVGPRDFLGDPRGGQAVIIINQELRYRHSSGLGLCLFYDTGNVFPTIDEISLDFRHTVGVGPRWNSPFGMLRLDFGFPLDRQENEAKWRYFFSLGQAF